MNAWVRSLVNRLSDHGHPVLVLPLFSRTVPDLELAYVPSDLVQCRRHKDATTADHILGDVPSALSWLRARH